MLPSKYEYNALKIKEKKYRKNCSVFFVLEVTARSAADILCIHPNSAALLYRKIRIVSSRHSILATDKILKVTFNCTKAISADA